VTIVSINAPRYIEIGQCLLTDIRQTQERQ